LDFEFGWWGTIEALEADLRKLIESGWRVKRVRLAGKKKYISAKKLKSKSEVRGYLLFPPKKKER